VLLLLDGESAWGGAQRSRDDFEELGCYRGNSLGLLPPARYGLVPEQVEPPLFFLKCDDPLFSSECLPVLDRPRMMTGSLGFSFLKSMIFWRTCGEMFFSFFCFWEPFDSVLAH
jgi:hypothetical protein